MRLKRIITMDLGKINYEDGTWVATAQDHAQWQYLTRIVECWEFYQ